MMSDQARVSLLAQPTGAAAREMCARKESPRMPLLWSGTHAVGSCSLPFHRSLRAGRAGALPTRRGHTFRPAWRAACTCYVRSRAEFPPQTRSRT
jgi:hypothetical protein